MTKRPPELRSVLHCMHWARVIRRRALDVEAGRLWPNVTKRMRAAVVRGLRAAVGDLVGEARARNRRDRKAGAR